MSDFPHPSSLQLKVIDKLPLPEGEGRRVKLRRSGRLCEGWVKLLYFISLFFFLSVPCHAFSFVVFGDNHGVNQTFNLLIDKVNQEPGLDMAFNVGDLVIYGTDKAFTEYQKAVSRLKVKVYNVMGNHDAAYGGWKIYQKHFGDPNYSFDYGNSHFVVLNNALSDSFNEAQFEWLEKDLAASHARHKFVFMHKPVFDPSELYKNHIMSGRQVTEELMGFFRKYKVDYVFTGHIHGYARVERDGVVYIISGGAGAPLYLPLAFGGFYHYVRVDVNGDKIADKVVKIYE